MQLFFCCIFLAASFTAALFLCSFFYSCTFLVQLLLQLHFSCAASFSLHFFCSYFFAAFFLAASFLGEGSLPREAMSSSPAMNCAHSQLAEGQQNSRLRAQTLLTFSHSPCSFRWSLQGLLRKTLPRHQALANKAVPARQPGRSSQTKCHRYWLKLQFCRASCGKGL